MKSSEKAFWYFEDKDIDDIILIKKPRVVLNPEDWKAVYGYIKEEKEDN